MFRCCAISHASWRCGGDTGLSWSSLPTFRHRFPPSLSPFTHLTHSHRPVASTVAMASSAAFLSNTDGSSCPADGHEVQRGAPAPRPRVRHRRPRLGGVDRCRLCAGVESAVAVREYEAGWHGNSQRRRRRSSSRRDSTGGSLDNGGFCPLLTRVSNGEAGRNGGRCTRLQQGDGAPAGVRVDPDARADARGHAASD
jgi:hypothetical protein